MKIDHIFIFSDNNGKEADDLVNFGLSEGSSRIHPGQGTRNRKFYFNNFFLEILWVYDQEEIRSKQTAPTQLWERSQYKQNEYSPFGLCLVNTKDTDPLFEKSESYQPYYFPKEMAIDMITNEKIPDFPWTFRLPFKGNKKNTEEPLKHPVGLKNLTKVIFEIPEKNRHTDFTTYFYGEENLIFRNGARNHLFLEFDDKGKGMVSTFPQLQLTIVY